MTEGIFHLGEDGNLIELRQQGFINEDDFQELLAKFPRLLPGTSAGDGEPWLLIERELSIPDGADASGRWSLDHVFVDREGVPTLVEVKRSTDTRLRREVVGQMLDYAANAIVYWPVDRLRAAYESRCESDGLEPAVNLQAFLGADVDVEAFWTTIKTNLQAGKIRMMFVADIIPKELQRIVEFLNEQMDPAEVLAVEMRQYVGGNTRSLVPRFMGRTAEAETRKKVAEPKASLGESEFLSRVRLAKNGGERAAQLAEELLRWAERRAGKVAFKGNSFSMQFAGLNGLRTVFSCWDAGEFSYWDALQTIRPFDDPQQRELFISRLTAVPGIIANRKSFAIRLQDTASLNGQRQLVAALDSFADAVDAAKSQVGTV